MVNVEIVVSFLARVIQESIVDTVICGHNLQGWVYFLICDNIKSISKEKMILGYFQILLVSI